MEYAICKINGEVIKEYKSVNSALKAARARKEIELDLVIFTSSKTLVFPVKRNGQINEFEVTRVIANSSLLDAFSFCF